MNKVGNNNPEEQIAEVAEDASIPRSAWAWFVGLIAVILCSLWIGIQVIGVLIAIVMPARPPLPTNANQTSYRELSYGVDEWRYAVTQDACAVAQFYVDQGGTCVYSHDCSSSEPKLFSEEIARCEGKMPFSQFLLRWQAVITTGNTDTTVSGLRLNREVVWSGQIVPTSTPPTLETSPTPVTP